MPKTYCVYILSNSSKMLYIGVTGNLETRIFQHKSKAIPGFSAKYNLHKLIYVEYFADVHDAIHREHKLKRWSRARKVALVKATNPKWADLSGRRFQNSAGAVAGLASGKSQRRSVEILRPAKSAGPQDDTVRKPLESSLVVTASILA